jgi:hypothetical protein
MRCTLASAALLLSAACSVERIGTATSARPLVGVPTDGYPSYDERLMLAAINRVRADPNNPALGTASACSATYPAEKPLMHNHDGARAARFHALHSSKNNAGLSHNSYCTLRSDVATSGCDGSDACACMAGTSCYSCMTLGGCGTDPLSRAGLFGFGANGEVGAVGNRDGLDAVATWVGECAGQDGHRAILTGANVDEIGLGHAAGDSCWGSFFFGDTGFRGVTTPVLPSGVHHPETGASFDFILSYWNGGPAASVNVVIDGVCHPMAIELGAPTNASYKASVSPISGCREYWFVAKDRGGARFTYPEVGSWGVGTCTDYKATRMDADCEGPAAPPDAGLVSPAVDAETGAPDAIGEDARAIEPSGDAGEVDGGGADAEARSAAAVPDTVVGSCRCVRGGRGAVALLALGLPFALFIRRRLD